MDKHNQKVKDMLNKQYLTVSQANIKRLKSSNASILHSRSLFQS